MISKIDILREHSCSWMFWSVIIKHTESRIGYIKKAINDTSNKHYGIIICNTLIDITEFKNTFNKDKKKFAKLLYNIIKGCITLNVEKFVWNIKQTFKHDNNRNIVFE